MLSIAHLKFSSPFILAPLAGYSDLPFRILCRQYGAGFCVSEMISCHGLAYGQQKTIQMLASSPLEKPVSFQLFGSDVSIMAKAADLLNEFSPDLVDINMGCPVKKVTKKGAGAALMANPRLAESIIREVKKNSTAPVTVKFRKGVDQKHINCVEFAKMAEQAGASCLAVHGRTWSQGFTGYADWSAVTMVKKSVSIPVIGNGDISSYRQAKEQLISYECDGIMIGRNALGNPMIFDKDLDVKKDFPTVLSAASSHLQLMEEHLDVKRMIAVIKNHIGRYFKGMRGSSAIRKSIYDASSYHEISEIIQSLSSSFMETKKGS